MKILVTVLTCFLVAVFINSAVGDDEAGTTSSTEWQSCPTVSGEQTQLYFTLVTIGRPCYEQQVKKTPNLQRRNTTIEQVQEFFNAFCQNEVGTRECLAEQASSLATCKHPTILNTFNVFRELIVKTLESGCDAGAKRFVTFIQGVQSVQVLSMIDNQLDTCGKRPFMMIDTLIESNVDISSKLYILHNEVRQLKECVSKVQLEQSMGEMFDYFINEIITTMKCIHPQDGTVVPCTLIDVALLSTPSICELKTHEMQLDLHDILENQAGKCFTNIMTDDRRIDTTDNDALRVHITDYCSTRKKSAISCMEDEEIFSDACYTETQRNEFKLLIESGKHGIESACFEDGKRLADVMFEVYRLKRTGHGHAVWDCIDVAKSTRNVTDEHRSSSKNMRFYHEVEAFKGCLVNKLQGDQTSVDAATSLIDEVLKKVECVNVEDGSTVTCESLMHHLNDHHDHHH